MQIPFINPHTQQPLTEVGAFWQDEAGKQFPKIHDLARFVEASNYTENFGFQWNNFTKTQINEKLTHLNKRVRK